MSVLALETPLQLADRPPRALRLAGVSAAETAAANADIQPWELNSELVLVCPELRRLSLASLSEPDSGAVHAELQLPVTLPSPAQAQLGVEPLGIVGYAGQRMGDTVRNGLSIIGALFTLAMLAQIFAR